MEGYDLKGTPLFSELSKAFSVKLVNHFLSGCKSEIFYMLCF